MAKLVNATEINRNGRTFTVVDVDGVHWVDATVGCEICGKLATNMVLDLWRMPDGELIFFEFEPQSKTHYFCDEHKRESRIDDK